MISHRPVSILRYSIFDLVQQRLLRTPEQNMPAQQKQVQLIWLE